MYLKSKKIENEKATVRAMIELFCRKNHLYRSGLCPDCIELTEYAFIKLDRCRYGDKKTACSKCSIHCYNKTNRNRIREVMRYSGPRMLFHHPVLAFKYILYKKRNAS